MNRKKKSDDRKQLLIRYKIDNNMCVSFIDPCCDEIPISLFGQIMKAISNVEKEWNYKMNNKNNAALPPLAPDEPTLK